MDLTQAPQNPISPELMFDRERAANYDKFFRKMSSSRDSMLVFLGAVMEKLPANARVLCVGAGTGNEVIYLADRFPGWTFTAVDPSAAMIELCREKVVAAGIADRCELHTGYLDELRAAGDYDAATCLLVSHFLMEKSKRRELFATIASHLKPGGLLVSSDLASAMDSPSYQAIKDPWFNLIMPTEATPQDHENARAMHGTSVSLLDPREVASIIHSAGFTDPVQIYQCLLIHGWLAFRAAH